MYGVRVTWRPAVGCGGWVRLVDAVWLVGSAAGLRGREQGYLASIHSQKGAANVDRSALKKLCKNTGVEVRVSKGKLIVEDGHFMGFLEVLDRRRYELELVRGTQERFRAASRVRI